MFSEFNTRAASLIIEAIPIYEKMLHIQDIYIYVHSQDIYTHTLTHCHSYTDTDTDT